jgi:hypothetical protein
MCIVHAGCGDARPMLTVAALPLRAALDQQTVSHLNDATELTVPSAPASRDTPNVPTSLEARMRSAHPRPGPCVVVGPAHAPRITSDNAILPGPVPSHCRRPRAQRPSAQVQPQAHDRRPASSPCLSRAIPGHQAPLSLQRTEPCMARTWTRRCGPRPQQPQSCSLGQAALWAQTPRLRGLLHRSRWGVGGAAG